MRTGQRFPVLRMSVWGATGVVTKNWAAPQVWITLLKSCVGCVGSLTTLAISEISTVGGYS